MMKISETFTGKIFDNEPRANMQPLFIKIDVPPLYLHDDALSSKYIINFFRSIFIKVNLGTETTGVNRAINSFISKFHNFELYCRINFNFQRI
jgi:hypothetical protein